METVESPGEPRARASKHALNYSRLRSPAASGTPGRASGETAGPGPVARTSSASFKILVAEDDLLNRMLVVRLLEKLGHEVTAVRNGREAVELASTESFDLVFMDMLMPELNGPEAASAIRRLERVTRKHLPIIALTASGDPADRELCLAAGMDAYASKPLSSQELSAAIHRFANPS